MARPDDDGFATVELALVAPMLLALMFLVTFAGRVSEADANVRRAASEAARSASLEQHAASATSAARTVAEANLAASGVTCHDLDVGVDTSDFRTGGTVTVTVGCLSSMRDLAFIGVPGTRVFTARAVEVIDRYRGEDSS
jgi:Flp pilus assembly protein TadG